MAIRMGLMARRINKTNKEGVSIYNQKHPDLPTPPVWAFGSAVDFKPSPMQDSKANEASRARRGTPRRPPLEPRRKFER